METETKEPVFLLYKTLIAAIPDVVFQTDVDGSWVFLNNSWTRTMGYSIAESLGEPFYCFLHPDDLEGSLNLFEQLITGVVQDYTQEIRCIKKSGAQCWIKIFAVLAKDPSGNITGSHGTLQEISEHKAQELELKVLRSSFVSLGSHQFRTPLDIMRCCIELSAMHIAKNGVDAAYLMNHIHTVINEIDQLNSLIEKVLTLGQMNAKIFACNMESVDLIPLIQKVLNDLELIQIDKRKVNFVVSGLKREITVDSSLITHALNNLVSNALKYSVGKPSPNVELLFADKYFQVIITDFGIGIPFDSQQQIATAFYRADNVRAIKGTGLGMFIAKRVVLLHKGELAFTSVEGEGAVFTIQIAY